MTPRPFARSRLPPWLCCGLLAGCATASSAPGAGTAPPPPGALSAAVPTADSTLMPAPLPGRPAPLDVPIGASGQPMVPLPPPAVIRPAPLQPLTSAAVPHVAAPAIPAAIRAVVDAADRTPEDRRLDDGRHPAQLLAFWGVHAGTRAAELGAGGGYTTELLARAVAPGGTVYAQNSPFVLQRFAAQPWAQRLGRPAMKEVTRLDRVFDDPLPAEAKNLDLVVSVLIYHDTVWMKVDRDRMNRAVFAALRPGGTYAIVDHSARPGAGMNDVETFHRIEEKFVIDDVERAGFRLAAIGDFLRNPSDSRDWNDSPRAAGDRRGTSDRFALTFVRP